MVAISALLAKSITSLPTSDTASTRHPSPLPPYLEQGKKAGLPKLAFSSGGSLASSQPTLSRWPWISNALEASDDFDTRRAISPQASKEGRSPAALARSALDSCATSTERERLVWQAADLRQQCQRLAEESKEQEQCLANQGAELAAGNVRCAELEETVRQAKSRLLQGQLQVGIRNRDDLTLEAAADEYRTRLFISDRSEDNLRQRLGVALHASSGLCAERAHLERKSHDAEGELRIVRAELDQTIAELSAAEDDNIAAAAALELAVAAGRRRVQEVSAEAKALLTEAWAFGVELPRARDDMIQLDVQLSAFEHRAEFRHADAVKRTRVLEVRIGDLEAVTARATKEAESHTMEERALGIVRAETEASILELAQCRDAECSFRGQLARTRVARREEEKDVAHTSKEATGLEEQRAMDAVISEERRRQTASAANAEHDDFRAELAHVRDVVARSGQSLGAIREQLQSLKRLSAHLEISEREASDIATELRSATARSNEAHRETLQHIQALHLDQSSLRSQLRSSSSVQHAHVDAAERERRNLVLEVAQLRMEEAQHKEFAVAEERHRESVEDRLRRGLCDAEKAWEADRGTLEGRNTRLAREALRLDSDRQRAEADLEEVQAVLEAHLAKHAEREHQLSVDLQATKQRAKEEEQNAERSQLMSGLKSEAEDLKAEHARLRQAVKRIETLNAGLRAQVHVFQQHHAEGAGSNGSRAATALFSPRTLGFSSLSSPLRPV